MDDFGVSFPLLADEGNEVAGRYGLVHGFPDDLKRIYRATFGVDLADYNGDESWTLPMPARYLVEEGDRVVRWASVSPDYTRRPDPVETLEALDRLHGS